jgi:RNA polymerase sigma-70 factor, ECF subfamily
MARRANGCKRQSGPGDPGGRMEIDVRFLQLLCDALCSFGNVPLNERRPGMIDEENFESFMSAYQNMVFTTAARLVGNEADAADISQEVFLKAYDRYSELSRSHRAAAWLRVVTRNLSLNHLSRYRSRWRFFSEMLSADSEESFDATLPAEETKHRLFDETDEHVALETALNKLPADQRVPLVLYHFEDMSYDEIARQLGISISKVKTDIHRGREALRRKLTSFTPGAPGSEIIPRQPTDRAIRERK